MLGLDKLCAVSVFGSKRAPSMPLAASCICHIHTTHKIVLYTAVYNIRRPAQSKCVYADWFPQRLSGQSRGWHSSVIISPES